MHPSLLVRLIDPGRPCPSSNLAILTFAAGCHIVNLKKANNQLTHSRTAVLLQEGRRLVAASEPATKQLEAKENHTLFLLGWGGGG